MKRIIYTLIVLATVSLTSSCNDYETYSDLKNRERDAIEKFISDSSFVIIGEDQFHAQGDSEGIVNMPLQIKGLKLSISLREDTEKEHLVWVSLRSVDSFPCNEMAARFFNGGGHLNASGGRLYCSIDEAVNVVRQALIAFEDKLK